MIFERLQRAPIIVLLALLAYGTPAAIASGRQISGICQVGPNAVSSMTCGVGEFCQLETGVCNDESGVHEGTCVESPFICSMEYEPVCACDGSTTYSNACGAHSVGVSVSRMGECDAKPDAIPTIATGQCEVGPNADSSMTCGAGEFCQLDTGVCNNKSGVHEGTCAETNLFCSTEYDPVCACDGSTTYSNACKAHSAGVSVSRMGECDAKPDGNPTIATGQCEVGPNADPSMACGAGEFCQLDTGVCNNKSGVHVGTCAATAELCIEVSDPVCACDGITTYSNACKAHSAGVSVSRMGECMTGSPIKNATATVATTDASATTTNATSFANDGNVPTSEPTKPLNTEVPTKSPNDLEDEGVSDGIPRSSCALNQSRVFSFCVVSAFMAIMAVSLG